MTTSNDISDLFERYTRVENEIKLLQDDKKQLLTEFKDRIDPKAFQSALRSAKIKAKLKANEVEDFDQILEVLEKSLCVDHLD